MTLNKVFRDGKSSLPFLLLFGLALGIRLLLLPFTNYDTEGYSRWYDFIVEEGVRSALGQNFAIYTPPYLYLLSFMTLTRNLIPEIIAIKMIPIFFDLVNAWLIYKILRLKYSTGSIPILAASVFLLAPTVVLNSAFWGQVDSFYTCFLLITLQLLLTDRPLPAMLAFGLALSIKAQAAFLAPFLLLLALKKRIPWYGFGLVPIAYLAAMLPAVLSGRPLLDVLSIYLNQAAELQIPSHNSPNWYIFVPQSTYSVSMPVGLLLAVTFLTLWAYFYSRRRFSLRYEIMLFFALVAVALMPFLLPKMHDRYFYPADVFSILLAFAMPELWFVSLGYQTVSTLAYSIFLFEAPRATMLILATQLNTFLVGYLLWKQHKLTRSAETARPQETTEAV